MKAKMENMKGYGLSTGYSPPSGNAGSAAKGAHSHDRNPLSVPRKGSSISTGSAYGESNADMQKMQSAIKQQAMKENLRGQSGC